MLPGLIPGPGFLKGGAAASGYQIARSLRFDGAANYLSRTPVVPATNTKKFTISAWIKRSAVGSGVYHVFFSAGTSHIQFDLNDKLYAYEYNAGVVWSSVSTAVYRDPSAWMHVVWAFDTTAASGSRSRLWVNGIPITLTGEPALNYDFLHFNRVNAHNIGKYQDTAGGFYGGYAADYIDVDGQSLDASNFGQVDAETGAWVPKAYAGTYGANGFKLNFSNTASLGADSSGNNNNWTPTSFDVTAGYNNDSLVDVPTNYSTDTGLGGEVRGNYCTLNPLDSGGPTTNIRDGNLQLVAGQDGAVRSTFWIEPTDPTGYYFEMRAPVLSTSGTLGGGVGSVHRWLTNASGWITSGWDAVGFIKRAAGGGGQWNYYLATISGTGGSADNATGVVAAIGDVLQVAIKQGKVWLGINNTWIAAGNPAAGTGQLLTVANPISPYLIGSTDGQMYMNFGQRPFNFAAPSGFKALCSQNLAAPIAKPSDYFDTNLRTGTGAAFAVTSKGFQPNLVWTKSRNAATDWARYNSVRGPTKDAGFGAVPETTEAQGLTAFTTDGFIGGTLAKLNATTVTFVDILMKQGTIPGFEINPLTGANGTNHNENHSLGVVPGLIIIKEATAADSWFVYHKDANAAPGSGALFMEGTQAFSASANYFNSFTATATQFGVGSVIAGAVGAYALLWAEVPGFSRISKYVGNGSANGPFVNCGFRPRWIMTKRVDSAGAWFILDTAIYPANPAAPSLTANSVAAESVQGAVDVLSNGFKLRSTDPSNNGSGATYVFIAFAERPSKYTRAEKSYRDEVIVPSPVTTVFSTPGTHSYTVPTHSSIQMDLYGAGGGGGGSATGSNGIAGGTCTITGQGISVNGGSPGIFGEGGGAGGAGGTAAGGDTNTSGSNGGAGGINSSGSGGAAANGGPGTGGAGGSVGTGGGGGGGGGFCRKVKTSAQVPAGTVLSITVPSGGGGGSAGGGGNGGSAGQNGKVVITCTP